MSPQASTPATASGTGSLYGDYQGQLCIPYTHHIKLDPRLAADTTFIADWKLCRVLLMGDARFPWLILVPRRPGLVELDDLADVDRASLTGEIRRATRVLRAVSPCDKLNVGALGNIVRQLHVHLRVQTIWIYLFSARLFYDPEEKGREREQTPTRFTS